MSDKIYCYPNSDVLINKLNIHDTDKLLEVERKLTMLRLMDLLEKPISGKFDLEHLRNIHKYIFQDIYPWAGKIRTVDIAKSNMFCKVQFIEMQAKEIFGTLQKDDYLKQLSKEKFAKRAAYYFSEINALHPFREGNGRTQRELIRQLACESGYILHFAAITETEMMEASIDSFVCDYKKMEALFTKIIEVR
ncbi:MAG: Fic family protein [Clostridium sp.]|nr:Fic family protein [Clostridium sp.]